MKTTEKSHPARNGTNEKEHQQKIRPCLWFSDQAEEATAFYTSLFDNSRIGRTSYYGEAGKETHRMEPGTVLSIDFQIQGFQFTALNAGPHFKFTPAISFFINCQTPEEVDRLWARLSEGGTALMPLNKYPFSEKYGWIEDKYGLSWQLNLTNDMARIVPSLLFVGRNNGKAEEAIHFYTSVFENSSVGALSRYKEGEGGTEGTLNYAAFKLDGQQFTAMDSSLQHAFAFTEAISMMIACQTQEEVDYFWDNLATGGDLNAQQCGWLKDKYGVSWQIVPSIMADLIGDPDIEKSGRVMKAMMQMKKLDIAELKKAYENK
nr:VOC family protein [Sunxiuqinia sp.]